MITQSRKQLLQQPAQFIERLSVLLQEGYTFEESIRILSPYHVKDKIRFDELLTEAFLTGQTPAEILASIGVKKRFLFAITIAQSTGDLAKTLQKISKDMQFYEQTRERFKRLLYYPLFLFSFVCLLFVAYRQLFLPRMQTMLHNRSNEQDVLSIKLSQLFLSMPDYLIYSLLASVLIVFVGSYFISRKDIRRQLVIYCSIPIIRQLFIQMITQQLARELGNLLLHGFSLQEALQTLKSQQHQKFVATIADDLLRKVKNGETLSNAVSHNDFLVKRFEQFVVHGEHSGMLGRELLIFADLLEQKLHSQLNTTLKIIQPTLLAVIALCVLAAYLSILLPIYNMIEFV